MNPYSNKHFLKYQMDTPIKAKHLKRIPPKEEPTTETLLTTKANFLAFERLGVLGTFKSCNDTQITDNHRRMLVEWMYQTVTQNKMKNETFVLAVNIYDAYVSRKAITTSESQLFGISSIFLAARYTEIYPLEVDDFVFLAGNKFSSDMILETNKTIFKALGCNVNLPNDLEYMRHSSADGAAQLDEHLLVKHLVFLSMVKDFDILPSVRVTAIRYIVCAYLKTPFTNTFDIDPSYIEFYTEKIHSFVSDIVTTNANWKIFAEAKKSGKWTQHLLGIKRMFFPFTNVTPVGCSKTEFFKPVLELELFPVSKVKGQQKWLGAGSYGVVKSFHYAGKDYAIKKHNDYMYRANIITSTFLREVSLLLSLDHPNIMKLRYVSDDLSRIFLDLGTSDLRKLIDNKGPLNKSQQVILSKQLLSALVYMHDNGVIHRDIKPQNVIVFNNTFVLSDFGGSRGSDIAIRSGAYTRGVCSLWYRSPEVLLGKITYGDGLDVWSLMCLLYEAATGKVIFGKNPSESDQLDMIFFILGTPNETTWPGVSSLPGYNKKFRQIKPQDDYFDKNVMLSDCYKELINTGLIMDPDQRPRARFLMSIAESY